MHRTHRQPWLSPVTLLLALFASGLPAGTRVEAASRTVPLLVHLSECARLRMFTRKPIKAVDHLDETIALLRPVVGDPTSALVIGQQSGVTHFTLEDEDGRKEFFEIHVQDDIELLRSEVKRLLPTATFSPGLIVDNVVFLSGTVTRAEDIAVILNVANTFNIKVKNDLHVGDAKNERRAALAPGTDQPVAVPASLCQIAPQPPTDDNHSSHGQR